MASKHYLNSAVLLSVITMAVGCQQAGFAEPAPTAIGVDATVEDIPSPTETPFVPTAPPQGYYIEPGAPPELSEGLIPALENIGLVAMDTADQAIVRLVSNPGPDALLVSDQAYAVVVPFTTVLDAITLAALRNSWQTGDVIWLPGYNEIPALVVSQETAAMLTQQFGAPVEGLNLQLVEAEQIADAVWQATPAIGIMPFDQLEPHLKVLQVDDYAITDKNLQTANWPLTLRYGILTDGDRAREAVLTMGESGVWPSTNRDTGRMTSLVMTGVTAMARSTAMQIELRGYDFPSAQIMPFFANADILHTSNEVAFAPDCPPPDWFGDPIFCSDRKYYEVLNLIGLDIVELTGNHVNDWGADALVYTLDIYDANNLPYYGGGRNLEDAQAAQIITTQDGTQVAFVGCNSAGPYGAWATEVSAGAAPCEDWIKIKETIAQLKANGAVVVVTLQYQELPYYQPDEQQRADFESLAAAGADIVSGSQAHQPQGFSFAYGSFIHFGVGNLFFDQMDFIENRQMFADKHIIYEGRHISTELFTGLMEYYAQPRPMTPEERIDS